MEAYESLKRLGFGAHGSVYLVKHKASKKLFALKKIEVDERKKTRTKEAVMKEASILSQLKHPHIVLYHKSFVDPSQDHVCIILDLCDGGNLSEKIEDASQNGLNFSEKQVMQWFIQIVMAVQYMHSKHILHRDLKAENVFLNKRNVVKLGDFGISKILDNTIDVAKTVVGTPSYLSPELVQDIPYNSKSDIWAVGCLLYEMTALSRPFDGNSLIGLFFNIIKGDYQPLPADSPRGICDLVASMLVKTPENRPSASAMLNVPYVKSHLASFISDTENIRALRGRRDNPGDGGDTSRLNPTPRNFAPSPSLSPVKRPASHPSSKPLPPLRPFSATLTVSKPLGDIEPLRRSKKKDASPHRDDEEAEYSDDFDESSASEAEESAEVVKCEAEAAYVDDFEDSDEDLDEVVTLAKEAQDLEPSDDFFEEEEEEDILKLSQTLTSEEVKQFRDYMKRKESDC